MAYSRNFNDKVVLITGSSSGIGATTAVAFSKSGAQVVITGRIAENLSQVGKECNKVSPKGLKALELALDVTQKESANKLIDSTISEFGKLDVLVNNAGAGELNSIRDENILEVYDRLFDLNVRSVVYLTHLSVEHLEKTKGVIINISSVVALKPNPSEPIYSMTKSALDMFTKCLALELGPKGIRVNNINPAVTRTRFFERLGVTDSEKFFADREKNYPLGRVGEPEDISNAILFLASNESSFVTGIDLIVDGGVINN